MSWFKRRIIHWLNASNRFIIVGVFGYILDPESENDISTFVKTFMEAMRIHNLWMAPKVPVLVHHVPEYVRRTGVPLGPTPEQALDIQHRWSDIFCHKFKANCTESPVFRERLLNAVLHYNAFHL